MKKINVTLLILRMLVGMMFISCENLATDSEWPKTITGIAYEYDGTDTQLRDTLTSLIVTYPTPIEYTELMYVSTESIYKDKGFTTRIDGSVIKIIVPSSWTSVEFIAVAGSV